MAKPKLALIPAAQGTKFYSVLPSDGSGDFTFTRGSVATRINAQGLIENVASGQSRLDYPLIDGVQKGCPHHILEPQSTNLITYSESFSNSYWTKTGASIVLNSTISPDGSLNASKLVEDNTNSLHAIFQNAGITIPSGNNTLSVFVKSNGRNFFQVRTGSAGGVDNSPLYANFDLINNSETASSVGVINSKIETYPNNWKKISITFNLSSGTSVALVFQPILSGTSVINESYQGDGTSGVYIFGAQLEAGSFPTSYIPTNGESGGVTRSAETASGAGQSSTFNDSEGVLMFETKFLQNARIGITNTDDSDEVVIGLATGLGIFYRIRENTSNPITQFVGVSEFENNKIALKYKSTETSFFVNGFELNTNSTSYTLNGLNELAFKSEGTNFYGNTKSLAVFKEALTDLELECLVSWMSFSDLGINFGYTVE